MYLPLDLPPGMQRAGTEYRVRGRWFDGSLVRFYAGAILPVGGWRRINPDTTIEGRPCGMFTWRTDGLLGKYAAIGSSTKLYVYNGTDVVNITPEGFVGGRSDAAPGLGWGIGNFGAGNYGDARPNNGLVLTIATWSLDAWGSNLVACCSSDGKLYEWDPAVGDPALPIANSPTNCLGLLVTGERMLVALGAGGDGRKVAWSDQEDNTDWTPAPNNTAGDFTLSSEGRLVAGRRTRGNILLWTETDLHAMTYIGGPFVYSFDRVGSACGAISPNCMISTGSSTVWMGDNAFFVFDGYARPLPCDVADYVFGDLNRDQKSKVTVGHVGNFGEIWWFYPSAASTENDRYVVWNYRENHWTLGHLSRTAWTDNDLFPSPMGCDAHGALFDHESGWTNDGAPILDGRYLRSAPAELGDGKQVYYLTQILPDDSGDLSRLRMRFLTRQTPEGPETDSGPVVISQANGYADCRLGGRQIAAQFEAVADASWRLGRFRFDAKPGGKR
jgi:hypothetical protein